MATLKCSCISIERNIVLLKIVVEFLNWCCAYFTWLLVYQIKKFPALAKRASVILLKVKSCNCLSLMPLLCFRSSHLADMLQ